LTEGNGTMSPTTAPQTEEDTVRGPTPAEAEVPRNPISAAERACDEALYDAFLDARARARGPLVCVNGRVIAWNAAAVRLVVRSDRAVLWEWARHAIEDDDRSVQPLRLRDLDLSAHCEGVLAGFELVGAVIRMGASSGGANRAPGRAPKSRGSFGWESLRESELGIAELVADGLTNRDIGARLFLSRHTVDSHLRQIFRKLGVSSRVELTRLVVEHATLGDSSVA